MLAALDTHSLTYAVAGLAAMAGAFLPRLVRDLPVSTPLKLNTVASPVLP